MQGAWPDSLYQAHSIRRRLDDDHGLFNFAGRELQLWSILKSMIKLNLVEIIIKELTKIGKNVRVHSLFVSISTWRKGNRLGPALGT